MHRIEFGSEVLWHITQTNMVLGVTNSKTVIIVFETRQAFPWKPMGYAGKLT